MVINNKRTIRAKKTYSWKDCVKFFGRRDDKRTFEYLRYVRGAGFILGPGTHRTPWNKKYYITGKELYRFVRSRRPEFIQLLSFIDE